MLYMLALAQMHAHHHRPWFVVALERGAVGCWVTMSCCTSPFPLQNIRTSMPPALPAACARMPPCKLRNAWEATHPLQLHLQVPLTGLICITLLTGEGCAMGHLAGQGACMQGLIQGSGSCTLMPLCALHYIAHMGASLAGGQANPQEGLQTASGAWCLPLGPTHP